MNNRTVLALLLMLGSCSPPPPDRPIVALPNAVKDGNIDQVKAYLYWCRKDGNCDVNAPLKERSEQVPTLFVAVASGQVEILRLLVAAGADVNAHLEIAGGMTPLFVACSEKTSVAPDVAFDLVEILIEAGADVHAIDDTGLTPLHLAKTAKCAEALLAAGANPNAGDKRGIPPLFYASDAEVAKALIDGGADVDVWTKAGTPLDNATATKRADVVRILLDAGANVDGGSVEALKTLLPDWKPNAEQEASTRVSATVTSNDAKFSIPVSSREKWAWNFTGVQDFQEMEYRWDVTIQNGVSTYVFGFWYFNGGPEKTGSLADLISAGTMVSNHRVPPQPIQPVEAGAKLEAGDGEVVIRIAGRENVEKVFSARPSRVDVQIQQPGQNRKVQVPVLYE